MYGNISPNYRIAIVTRIDIRNLNMPDRVTKLLFNLVEINWIFKLII